MTGGGIPADLKLHDGSRIHVRAGRASDKPLLVKGLANLSAASRYKRFLAPVSQLSRAEIAYLTEVDHHDHEALVALDAASGEGVGVARFVRLEDRPDRAEAAVTVADAWQGRGVGTALLELLADRAREEGITHFRALLLARNQEMLGLLSGLGTVEVMDRQLGTVEIEIALAEHGPCEPLHHLLRASARAR